MTTSEHADEWPAGRLAEGARGSSGPYPPLTNRNEVAAALAPSPVQGADDRLAQAEAVINVAMHMAKRLHRHEYLEGRESDVELSDVIDHLATYQQSPQAALNEVQAGAILDFANLRNWGNENWRVAQDAEARAAELRANTDEIRGE